MESGILVSEEIIEHLDHVLPHELPNFRARRYRGDDAAAPVRLLDQRDRKILFSLYAQLQDLLGTLSLALPTGVLATRRFLYRWLQRVSLDDLLQKAHAFGLASRTQPDFGRLGCAIHDARGGGLAGIFFHLETFDAENESEGSLRSLFFYTRDQLKVLRNAFLGLDDHRREIDLHYRLHSAGALVEKLRTFACFHEGTEVALDVQSRFDGNIAACCCESAALDRALHNCLNNACRHTADGQLRLYLLPVPEPEGPNLRLIIANTITATQRAQLSLMLDGNEAALFEPGTSTTGSGLGLAIVRDFVAEAFGLSDPDAAAQGGYVGVRVENNDFLVYFHWPVVSVG